MDNIEFFKCHNYGHMALDCSNKNVWKRKQVQEDKADTKVLAVMLSGFVKAKGHEELVVASDNESSQDGPLGDSLFWTIWLVDSLMFVQDASMKQYMAQFYDWQEGSLNKMVVLIKVHGEKNS